MSTDSRLGVSIQRRLAYGVAPVCCAIWQVFALFRFYRRFIYDEADGRIWGLADDVYISACFGRSLFSGQGFVWYPGAPRVEGISNPLWSVAIGALHRLPGFSEARLGAYVIALNALLLIALSVLFWSSLLRANRERSSPAATWLLILLLVPFSASLAYWSAEGFEVALLAVIALAMLHVAFGATSRRNALAMGALMAAGLATRMDFLLLAVPALCLYTARRGWPQIRRVLVTSGILVLVMLLARRTYYGEWLPNTYWLKATGWPLADRLRRGFDQNAALLVIVPLPWLALMLNPVRRHILHEAPHALAAWFGFALTVLYSTYVGGDSWGTFGGYDRHTAVGGLLLIWGLAAVVASFGSRWAPSCLACAVALPLVAWPVMHSGFARVETGLVSAQSPVRALEREWIQYGKAFREISRPGARIAVCPAGAIVYFSERGGVDLLGKVDPFVAHLTVSNRRPPRNVCWRNAPGHNKEDDASVFKLRQPEFSRYHPPRELAKLYVKLHHKGMLFYALQSTPFLLK